MTLFAVVSWDSPDAGHLRAEHLQAHLAYAESILDKIAVGGPFREGAGPFFGSLIVLKVGNEAEARAILEADPYYKAGVWARTEIHPFRAVIGEWVGGKNVVIAALALAVAATGVQPWTETVVSVENIGAASRLFREAGGWTVQQSGRVDAAEIAYWKLPATARGTFQRLCAPKVATGCIRFVRWTGVVQRPIRRAARAWDTGGIYSIMVRSDNVPALFDQALKLGWWAEADPIRLTFGTSDLRNVVLVGPHGINLAVYERISPPFTAFPVGRISQAFSSMRMVRAKPAARDFYRETLGFPMVFDSDAPPKDKTRSNFGIPYNYTTTAWRDAAALVPVMGEAGRVEVMQIDGFEGSDLSEFAQPQNLGIVSLRYPVTGLAAYRARLVAKGVGIAYEARGVRIAGIGLIDLFAVRDPDGNISEFYEGAK